MRHRRSVSRGCRRTWRTRDVVRLGMARHRGEGRNLRPPLPSFLEVASMKLLSIDELKPAKGISFSKPHLYRLIKAGRFPKPVKIGENRNGFVESEIDAWLRKKVEERDAE